MPLSAAELRAHIKRLGISQTEAAERLGLSTNGLYKQLHGERKVSRQTEIILDLIEEVQRLRHNQRQAEQPMWTANSGAIGGWPSTSTRPRRAGNDFVLPVCRSLGLARRPDCQTGIELHVCSAGLIQLCLEDISRTP